MLKKNCHIKLFSQTHYTEGPVIDDAGNIFFTTLTGGIIWRMTPDERFTPWAQSQCPNGQILLPNGQHLVCDSKLSAVILFDQKGLCFHKEINKSCAGEKVAVPNDLIADKKGNVYFTDSIRNNGKLFFVGTNGEQKMLSDNLDYPNGLALSNDERTLFVAESYQNRILAFDIERPGFITDHQVWINLPRHPSQTITNNLPDGIKVDNNDNLWVAHYGMGMIHRITSTGTLIQSISLPFNLVSNLFIKNNLIVVTGGYSEPGPGGIAKIILSDE